MPTDVYRCRHCGREVLVRSLRPMSEAEVARRIEEEMRPAAPGRPASPPGNIRLRDDIWVALSTMRDEVAEIPRGALPERCPACGRGATFSEPRELG